jgi:anti-sigma B factor antagonist
MRIDVTPLGEHLVKVEIEGRLDTPGVDRVETRLVAALVPGGNSGVIDFSKVDFIASMGIRMLVSTARSLKMRNATLALYGVQEAVNQVFELVSLRQILPVCATEAEALAAVASPRLTDA